MLFDHLNFKQLQFEADENLENINSFWQRRDQFLDIMITCIASIV